MVNNMEFRSSVMNCIYLEFFHWTWALGSFTARRCLLYAHRAHKIAGKNKMRILFLKKKSRAIHGKFDKLLTSAK